MNQKAYEEIIKEMNNADPIKRFIDEIKNYSPKRLLSAGREFANNSRYLEAKFAFDELEKINEFRNLSDLYQQLIFSLSSIKFRKIVHSRGYDNESLINSAIYCMMESTKMYADGEILKEDLFTIESLIDRLPFKEMPINREFEKLYCKFKLYSEEIREGKNVSR